MTKLSYTNRYGEYIEVPVSSYEAAQDLINQNSIEGIEMSEIEIVSDDQNETQKCRICGCDQDHACKGGCSWVEPDLCSQCYQKINSWYIQEYLVQVVNKNSYKQISSPVVIADEIESFDKAEGFVYGYIEGKGGHQYRDDNELELKKIYLMLVVISEAQFDESVYFFERVNS